MSLTFYTQYTEVHAIFPLVIAGVALAPEVIAGIGCLLTAAGIYALNKDQIDYMARNAYDNASMAIKEKLIMMVGEGISTSFPVDDDTWNYAKSYVDILQPEHGPAFGRSILPPVPGYGPEPSRMQIVIPGPAQ